MTLKNKNFMLAMNFPTKFDAMGIRYMTTPVEGGMVPSINPADLVPGSAKVEPVSQEVVEVEGAPEGDTPEVIEPAEEITEEVENEQEDNEEQEEEVTIESINAEMLAELDETRSALEKLQSEHTKLLKELKENIFKRGAITSSGGQNNNDRPNTSASQPSVASRTKADFIKGLLPNN